MITLNLLVSLVRHKTASDNKDPVMEFRECRVLLHYYYSHIHSDPEW